MKQIAQIRRENLELLIAELGTLDATADACGSSSVYLSQVRNQAVDNKTGRPREMGAAIARRLESGCKKPSGWMDHDHDITTETASAFPVPAPPAPHSPRADGHVNIHELDAHPVSRMAAWEELCMPDLPNVFKLTLQDDSLAPKHQRGDFVELQRDLVPAAGDWVLVRLSHDEHTIRSFVDLGTEGWAAAPINKPGEAITSKSGASVVAVYIGGGVSGRMSSR